MSGIAETMRSLVRLTPRGWLAVGAVLLLLLAVTMPLRLAASLAGLDSMGVAARSMDGSIWSGSADSLQAGSFRLGTVRAGLSPWSLLVGQARFSISRRAGMADDLEGALSTGLAGRGIEHVTGMIPAGNALAPLPLVALEFYDVTIRFSGGRCQEAGGRLRAVVPAVLPGIDLANGLSGEARCDGAVALIPLVGQSGLERIDLRVGADGSFHGTMTVPGNLPGLGEGLTRAGFRAVGGNLILRASGRL
jgi:general secretion pathway protein N